MARQKYMHRLFDFMLGVLCTLTTISTINLHNNGDSTFRNTQTIVTKSQGETIDEDGGGDGNSRITQKRRTVAEQETKSTTITSLHTVRDTQDQCWRHCPQRINKIYFEHGWAGLGDRHVFIHNLAQITGYLCAKQEMAPPSISLNPDHNNGELVSKKVQWQDLRNLTFQRDKSQVLGLDPSFEEDFEYWRRVPVYNSDKYSDWLHLTNTDHRDFISDYEKLQEFSWRQKDDATTGFIWEIHSSFYESNVFEEPMLPEPSKEIQDLSNYDTKMRPLLMTYRHFHPKVKKDCWGCLYANDDDSMGPSNLYILRERLKRRVQRKSPQNTTVYGYFHIRRGDTIDECDTRHES
jgi:hypothetical protein